MASRDDETDPGVIARSWWMHNDARDFTAAAALCATRCTIDWPLSGERFPTPGDWAAAMEHYPGLWRCMVQTLVASEDRAVTIARIFDATTSVTAISLFRVTDGRITELVEYWPEPYDPPEWRARWVTPIPTGTDGTHEERRETP